MTPYFSEGVTTFRWPLGGVTALQDCHPHLPWELVTVIGADPTLLMAFKLMIKRLKTLLHSCLIKWEASWPGADKSPHTFFFFFFKYIIFLQIFIQSLFLTLLVRPASSDLQPHVLPFSLLPSTFVLPVMTLVILDRFLHYPVFPLSFSCAHHFFPLHCLFTYASPPTPLTCFRCIEGEIRGFWSKTTQLLPWSA